MIPAARLMAAAGNAEALRWFWIPEPRPDAPVRLFCLPFAGAAAAAYRTWPRALPSWVETCVVELPGHGSRRNEPLLNDLRQMVAALQAAIGPLLDRTYVLFGHSMGAWIAYELALRLQQSGGRAPQRLIVSGAVAPHRRPAASPIHTMPEHEFLEKIRDLNGTPEQVLNTPELLQIVSPTLRADFQAAESYRRAAASRLLCPILAFAGAHDKRASVSQVRAWAECTSRAV